MKHLTLKIYGLLLAAMCLFSCEKEEDRVTLRGGNPPVLVASTSTDVVLTKAQENFSSLQFQWTNPEYEFSNGANTQDVFYTLEIDTAGANFSNPKKVALSFPRDLSKTFTVKELNNTLSVMELKDFVSHNFEFRVKATLPNGAVPLYSNVIPLKITTYLDVIYPVPAKLYITGAATPKDWMTGGDAPEAAQEFTKINSYTFQLTIPLKASSAFLFVPVYGNWSNKYGFTGANLANNPTGDSFKPEGGDMVTPGATKAYKITVNFKTGKYTLE
jgi:starch-binding outer membrane protein SusE/F